MKALKSWLYMLATNAAVFFGLYQWNVKHLEGAGNVVTAWLVFIGVASLIAGFAGDKTWFKEPAMPVLRAVSRFLMFATAGVLFYFGHFFLGALCIVGNLCMSVARDRDPKTTTKP